MLQLSTSAVELMTRWARNHSTVEVVGMVWQFPSGFQSVHPLSNRHSQPSKYYTIDPEELKRAYRLMEEAGAQVLAFYHSHPGGKPDPSEEDMAGALNVGVHYLIAYPELHDVMSGASAAPVATYREWRLSAWECIDMGILVEDKLEVVP